MSAYSDLDKISLEYAISAIANLAVPRGSKDKILLVSVNFSVENFEKNYRDGKTVTFVIYRPMSYCFVGMIEGLHYILQEGCDVHYETYHSSCWRDGINRMVRKVGKDLWDKVEKKGVEKGLHVFNSFSFVDPKIIEGKIKMDDDNYTAKFVGLVKKD